MTAIVGLSNVMKLQLEKKEQSVFTIRFLRQETVSHFLFLSTVRVMMVPNLLKATLRADSPTP